MQLLKETIQEFKKIYLRKEGKELSDKEALEIVTNLLLLFEAIYHPIPEPKKNKKPKRELMQFLVLNDTISL